MAGLPVVEGEAAPDQAPECQAIEDIKQLIEEHGDEGERVLALWLKAWEQGNIRVPRRLRPSAARFESAWPAYNIRRTLGDYSWDKLKSKDGRDLPHVRAFYRALKGKLGGLKRNRGVSVLGRPASVMRARRTACTYPSAANPHTACCRLRIYMEGNARIYVNGQLPGPPSVHSPPLLI